ncbi:MAG: TonB-dependent receptor, partial [Proteobacteria bacterium]|nr:TonB-dependent receptor [Pseudomonadota bacterium]
NIRTRRPDGPPRGSAAVSYGSFDSLDARAASDGRVGNWAYDLGAGHLDSEGYRDNGFLRKTDAGGKVSRWFGNRLAVDLSGSWYEARQGLPGPVPAEWVRDEDLRQNSRSPDDFSETQDLQASVGLMADLEQYGEINVRRSYRFRDDSYLMGFSPLIPRPDQTDDIEENSRFLNAGYRLPIRLLGRDHEISLGLDQAETDYIRQENSRRRRTNSRIRTLGVFATASAAVLETVTLKGGLRREDQGVRFRDDARKSFGGPSFWVNGVENETDFGNQAWEAGLVWKFVPGADLFGNVSQSFRAPNVDELAFAAGDLVSQEGLHLDAGVRARLGRRVELSLSLFQIRMKDEIFFDQTLQKNRNFEDDTLRQGLEAGVRAAPTGSLLLWANAAWLTAEFENTGATVPLVPEWTASGGADLDFLEHFLLSLSGQWVGERYDGNDFSNNRYEKLDAYLVADARLRYRRSDFEVWLGVGNVFNEMYSTLAYSEAYYPMQGRSVSGGVKWSFP